mgnify:CR=1 FL=1
MITEAFLDHDVIITKDSKMEEMYDLNEELGKYVIHIPTSTYMATCVNCCSKGCLFVIA